jgi:hypothetical protein
MKMGSGHGRGKMRKMVRWGRAMLNDLFSVNTASFQAVFMANIGILEAKT